MVKHSVTCNAKIYCYIGYKEWIRVKEHILMTLGLMDLSQNATCQLSETAQYVHVVFNHGQ